MQSLPLSGLPRQFTVNRYRSLAIRRDAVPSGLEITAWADDGEIMATRHAHLAAFGTQFHPESILTEHGHAMLHNFLVQPVPYPCPITSSRTARCPISPNDSATSRSHSKQHPCPSRFFTTPNAR